MLYNNRYRPAFATAGQASSTQRNAQSDGILFNAASESEDFNSFSSSPKTGAPKRPAPKKKKPAGKTFELDLKKLLVIAASVAAFILVVVIAVLVATSSGGTLKAEDNTFTSYEVDGKFYIAMNGTTVGEGFDNELTLVPAIDNSFAYVVEDTPDGYNIYLLEKKELISIVAAPVQGIVALADYEPGVVYKDNDAYYFYSDETEERITKDPTAGNFVIAPDASVVSYTLAKKENANEFKLYLYANGSSESYATNKIPVAVSSKGKYIYAYDTIAQESADGSTVATAKLYLIMPSEGESVTVATGFDKLTYMTLKGDEIVYTLKNDAGVQSHIYRAKKNESFKIGTGECKPMIADSSVALLSTLKDTVFESSITPAPDAERKFTAATYYVNKNYDSSLLANYKGKLNSDGDVFYFINNEMTLKYIDLGDKTKTAQKVSDFVEDFVITEKGNIYFLDDEDNLMFFKSSTAKKKRIAHDVELISINEYANVLYFAKDDDTKAYETEEGSAPEITKFDRTEIVSAPFYTDNGQKRTFAYIYNVTTGNFELYYTSTGKSYKLIATGCYTDDLDFEYIEDILGGGEEEVVGGEEAAE